MPAVMASTLSCDISFGTEMDLEKTGVFVEIISARVNSASVSVHTTEEGRGMVAERTFITTAGFGASLETVSLSAERGFPERSVDPHECGEEPCFSFRRLAVLVTMHRHAKYPLPNVVSNKTQSNHPRDTLCQSLESSFTMKVFIRRYLFSRSEIPATRSCV